MRVLLADADEARAARLEARLLAAQPVEVVRLGPAESLAEAALRRRPDLVIVDLARADRCGLERDGRTDPPPVVLFVGGEDAAFMEEAILRAAIAILGRFGRLEAELACAQAALDERRAVDRAKALLMHRRGLSEPQAYALLRRRAMDGGRRIAEVAAQLLAQGDEG